MDHQSEEVNRDHEEEGYVDEEEEEEEDEDEYEYEDEDEDEDEEAPRFLHHIKSIDEWQSLAATPETHRFARAEVVKFIIERHSGTLYFTNTQWWDQHYYFIADNFGTKLTLNAFNNTQYTDNDRLYAMGSLVRYLDHEGWVLEIAPNDTMGTDLIKESYDRLVKATYFGDQIQFRSQSIPHDDRIEALNGAIPILEAETFQASIQYQPLTLGESYGYLRFIEGAVDPATVRDNQILVTSEIPDDLPVCAGLITSRLQAPLGHIALLLDGRRTVNMALRNAVKKTDLRALEGQLVWLEVDKQNYYIEPATIEEAKAWWGQREERPWVKPSVDPTNIGLVDLCHFSREHIGLIGGKAAYLGDLCHLKDRGIKIPSGFVIPIYEYLNHIQSTGIDKQIAALLKSSSTVDRSPINSKLKQIQAAIQAIPVSTSLLTEVKKGIRALKSQKIILRSSANAEDIEGFSGAGLYNSKIISAQISDEALADAIRYIWSSVWNIRAYQERNWYHIDHQATAMAVIVQAFVDNAVANGVAITTNPYYDDHPGVLINVQTMEGSVTGSTDGALPESILAYTHIGDLEDIDNLEMVTLSRSTLTGGKPILSMELVRDFAVKLQYIHDHFIGEHNQEVEEDGTVVHAMDVEFLINKKQEIIFVQARPYSAYEK